uniref:inosine-uridine preferring nucleoside hydrolase-like n=1 Tax=Styela clava TaxID=7725 RepID=UPI001939D97F|nr:inosine-uridine preferring nucleoside hydrolase-like [Styela clava]
MNPDKYILIDCDPGVDDCFAITMALSQNPKVKVVGITCVNGNVNIKQVAINTVKTVKLCGMLDQVPIFKGCGDPVIIMPGAIDSTAFHGKDGMGDVPDVEPRADEKLLEHVQEEHGVNAIMRLAKEYEGKLEILAIGPLTNIAIAVRLDPDLTKRLKALHILGGTLRGHRNITPCSEYNFYVDPEAAQMTLRSFSKHCLVRLVTYETTLDHAVPVDWLDQLLNGKDKKRTFFREIYKRCQNIQLHKISEGLLRGYTICDIYAVCVALEPNCVKKSRKLRMGVELGGHLARGSLIIDHRNKGSPFLTEGTIEVIEEICLVQLKDMLARAFS